MSDTRLSDLAAASALSASDLFYVVQSAGSGGEKATGTQFLTLVGTAYVAKAGGTMTGALTIASGTLTASAPALSITQTWNAPGLAMTGLLMNITNTSSLSSRLLDLQIAGVTQFTARADGYALTLTGHLIGSGGAGGIWNSTTFRVPSNGAISWSVDTNATNNSDIEWTRFSAGVLAQRRTGVAQEYRVYPSYTDSSNYQYLSLSGNGTDTVTLSAVGLGTPGANQDIAITPGGTGVVKFGTRTAIAAETVTGYITIKDAGGTVRKLAVVS